MPQPELEALDAAVERLVSADMAEVDRASLDAEAILSQPTVTLPDLIGWWGDHGPAVRRWLKRLQTNFVLRLLGFFARFIGALCRLGEQLADILDRLTGLDTRTPPATR